MNLCTRFRVRVSRWRVIVTSEVPGDKVEQTYFVNNYGWLSTTETYRSSMFGLPLDTDCSVPSRRLGWLCPEEKCSHWQIFHEEIWILQKICLRPSFPQTVGGIWDWISAFLGAGGWKGVTILSSLGHGGRFFGKVSVETTARPNSRIAIRSDSQVLLGSVIRGRSSSSALNGQLRQALHGVLGQNCYFFWHYINTKDNPADDTIASCSWSCATTTTSMSRKRIRSPLKHCKGFFGMTPFQGQAVKFGV